MKNKILNSIKILLETWLEISSAIVTTLVFIAIFYSNHIMINTNKQAILLGITGAIVGCLINKSIKNINNKLNQL